MIDLAEKWETSRRAMPWFLFWLGCALTLVGFVSNDMWTNMGWAQTALLAELGLAAALAGWLLNRLTGFALATSSAVIWLLALIYFAGFTSFGAVILLALVSMAMGSLLVPKDWTERAALSILGGLALISGLVGWLLPFPVHGRVAYLAVALAVVAVRWRHLADMFRPMVQGWRSEVAAEPAGMWLAVMTVGLVSTCAWLPTTHYDDLAYHIGLQSQLVNLGYYKMDAASNLWALSAWSADVLQAVAWILAGHESRGMLDAFWLLLGLAFIWRLSEALDLPPWQRCLAMALYASLPMTANTLKSMQTEGPTAALAAGVALLILRSPRPDRCRMVVLALLFGLLLGLKISNLMIAGPLGLWLLCRWRFRLPWRSLPTALLLLLLVAGSSYAYAWILAGNPVLPVFNAIFHSPYYTPTNFHDGHWNAGFRWNIVWNLVFHTSRYVEGGDGTAGFILITLGGSLLVALFNNRARPLALVALGSFLLPLTQIQYLRYAHQALPLLIPAMLCGIPAIAPNSRRSHWVGAALIVLVATNLAFVSTSGWQLRHGELRQFLTESRQDFLTRYAPMKRVMEVVDQRYGAHARVLITSDVIPYAAGFGGMAYVVSWYDQALAARAAQADRDATGQSWVRLVDDTGVNLLVIQSGHVSEALAAALALVHGRLVTQVGAIQLWQAQRAVTGITQVGPPGKVRLKFDTSSLPEGSTLVDAHVKLDCRPFGVPVAMSWTITERGVHPWTHSNWVNCLPDGTARANLSVAVPKSIVGFEVSALSATHTAMQLTSASSELEVRKDFGKRRDLARGMRERILTYLASWVDPWTAAGVRHVGAQVLPPPSRGVIVRYELPESVAGGVVRATMALECRYSPAPIVVGWKMAEHGVAPISRYAWARCGRDGVARAKFDARAKYRVVSLTASALPADGRDMALRLRNAELGFVATSGFRGLLNRQRIKLAEWLTPVPVVSRIEP
jgi:hypothetical protein